MKVAILTSTVDRNSSPSRRALRTASLLANEYEVELVSVDEPDFDSSVDLVSDRFAIISAVRRSTKGDSPARRHGLSPAQLLTLSTTPAYGLAGVSGVDRLAELELRWLFRSLQSSILIVTDARWTDFALSAVAPGTTVLTLHSGGVSPAAIGDHAQADATVSEDSLFGDVMRDSMGDHAAPVMVVGPWSPNPVGAGRACGALVVMFAQANRAASLTAAVEAMIDVVEDYPAWHLHVCVDGPVPVSTRRKIDELGRHGVISFGTRDSFSKAMKAAAEFVVICESEDDDSSSSALECFVDGIPVIIDQNCFGASSVVRDGIDGLVTGGTATELAKAIRTLIEDPNRLVEMSGAARRRSLDFEMVSALAHWQNLLTTVPEMMAAAASGRADRSLAAAALTSSSYVPNPTLPRAAREAREAEEELLSKSTEFFRWGGRISGPCNFLTEPDIMLENLRRVSSALNSAHLDFVLISRPFDAARVAVNAKDRPAVVAALSSQLTGSPTYVEIMRDGNSRPLTTLASELVDEPGIVELCFYLSLMTESRTLRYGSDQGCTVEFWTELPSGVGYATPRRPSVRGDLLTTITPDQHIEIDGHRFPITHELAVPPIESIDFPIDAVWTWVNDADKVWRDKRDAHIQHTDSNLNDPNVSTRYVNRDELKYSLRSVAMYAPWIRHLYIVTDGQTPDWLDTDHEKVSVVDHRDIFSDPGHLPTFNSHSIESQLHHIEGLSETFLYFNDDVFLGRKVDADMFFTPSMTAKAFPSPSFISPGVLNAEDRPFFVYRKNDRDLVEQEFGKTMAHSYRHLPFALRVSLLNLLERKYTEQWAATSASQFRSPGDYAVATSLAQGYGLLSGHVTNSSIRSRYVRAGTFEHQPLMRQILARRHLDAFCLNDTGDNDMSPEHQGLVMSAFMQAYFPIPAPWELT